MKNIDIVRNFIEENRENLTPEEMELFNKQLILLEKAYINVQKCLLEVENSEHKKESLNKEIEELSELAHV